MSKIQKFAIAVIVITLLVFLRAIKLVVSINVEEVSDFAPVESCVKPGKCKKNNARERNRSFFIQH